MPKLYKITLTSTNAPTTVYTVYYNSINSGTIATVGTTTALATNLTKAQLTGAGLKVTVPDSATSVILYNTECTRSTTFNVPPSVTIAVTSSSVTASTALLSWTTTPGGVAVAYLVYKNGILIATLGDVSSYNVTGLNSSTNYNFSVQAKASGDRVAGVSNNVSITTTVGSDTTAPSTPTNLSISGVTSTSMIIDWGASTDNVGIAGYKVYMNGSTTPLATIVTTQSTGTLSYNATGLTPSTSYYFTIKAYDSASSPNYSAGADSAMIQTNAAAGDTTPPTTPGTLSATAYPCYVALSWGASTDNSGSVSYDIYRGGLYWDSTSATYYEDNTGDAVTRTYTVKAVDGSGNRSAASNSVSKRALSCI